MPKPSLETLIEAGEEALFYESFKATEINGRIVTHCNEACMYICEKMGFKGFENLVANQIFDRMKGAPDFAQVGPKAAQDLANDGKLVVAAIKDKPHGHVAVCSPGKLLTSGKWGHEAPMTFNVGRENRLISANYGFADEPTYFAWIA